jgi:hypothetical protein
MSNLINTSNLGNESQEIVDALVYLGAQGFNIHVVTNEAQSNAMLLFNSNAAQISTFLGLNPALITDSISTPGFIYIGYAKIGTALSDTTWTISKIDTSNSHITYAGVVANIPSSIEVWNNRTTYTYT